MYHLPAELTINELSVTFIKVKKKQQKNLGVYLVQNIHKIITGCNVTLCL